MAQTTVKKSWAVPSLSSAILNCLSVYANACSAAFCWKRKLLSVRISFILLMKIQRDLNHLFDVWCQLCTELKKKGIRSDLSDAKHKHTTFNPCGEYSKHRGLAPKSKAWQGWCSGAFSCFTETKARVWLLAELSSEVLHFLMETQITHLT